MTAATFHLSNTCHVFTFAIEGQTATIYRWGWNDTADERKVTIEVARSWYASLRADGFSAISKEEATAQLRSFLFANKPEAPDPLRNTRMQRMFPQ